MGSTSSSLRSKLPRRRWRQMRRSPTQSSPACRRSGNASIRLSSGRVGQHDVDGSVLRKGGPGTGHEGGLAQDLERVSTVHTGLLG
jgi:hypothetical protein